MELTIKGVVLQPVAIRGAASPSFAFNQLYGVLVGSSSNAAASAAAAAASQVAAGVSAGNAAASAASALSDKNAAAASAVASEASRVASGLSAVAAAAESSLALIRSNLAAATLTAAQLIMLGYVTTTQAQAQLAASYAAQAASVVQQDLSGVDRAALHRSPNPVTASLLYDTRFDSDGGAWVERTQDKSWFNETLNGSWLGQHTSESAARFYGATLGADLIGDGSFTSGAGGWADFSTGGGAFTASSGAGVLSAGAAGVGRMRRQITTVANRMYELSFTASGLPGGRGDMNVGTTGGGSDLLATQTVVNGAQKFYFFATGVTTWVNFFNGSVNETHAYDDIKVREVSALNTKSTDYYQLASDGKFYRMWKNLLPDSSGATWSQTNAPGIVQNADTSPDGAPLTMITDGVAGTSSFTQLTSALMPQGVVVTLRVLLKRGNNDWQRVAIGDSTIAHATRCWVNTATGVLGVNGVVGASAPTVLTPWAISAKGNGVYEVTVTIRTVISSMQVQILNSTGDNSASSTTAGQTRYMGGLQLEYGAAFSGLETKAAAVTTQSETFRGNTAKFPRLAAIVAEADNVTMYALDQPGRPMWMRWKSGGVGSAVSTSLGITLAATTGINSLAMLNGILCVGRASDVSNVGGVNEINFLRDGMRWFSRYTGGQYGSGGGVSFGTIADRNVLKPMMPMPGLALAAISVNSIAMMVRAQAPVDTVTGLQIPTIGVSVGTGNAGQLGSIIMDDGSVVNYTSVGQDGRRISFNKRGEVIWGLSSTTVIYTHPLSATGGVITAVAGIRSYGVTTIPAVGAGSAKTVIAAGNTFASIAANLGAAPQPYLSLFRENPSTPAAGLSALITGYYNTGWMLGDVRRLLAADMLASAIDTNDLVANGTFATDISGWTNGTPTTGNVTWDAAGKLRITNAVANGSAAGFTQARYTITTVIGKTYAITLDNGPAQAVIGAIGSAGQATVSANGAGRLVFNATATSHTLVLVVNSAADAATTTFDNVSVKEVAADRSTKGMPSTLFGNLTRSPVAAAAQLVAYSGFTNDTTISAELVTNGAFAANVAGWSVSGASTITWDAGSGGRALVTSATAFATAAFQNLTTVIGRKYTVNVSATAGTGAPQFSVNIAGGSGHRTPGTAYTFTADSTVTQLGLYTGTAGGTAFFDDISVKAVDAVGTTANAMQEGYSSDLDFGTGAFSGSAWMNVPTTGFGPSNFVRNSVAAGAVVGVIGSGGAMPTNWGQNSWSGVTVEVVGSGVSADGVEYVRVRVAGTSTGTSGNLTIENAGSTPAFTGQVWSASAYVRLHAGSMANVTAAVLNINEFVGGVYSQTRGGVPFQATINGNALGTQRQLCANQTMQAAGANGAQIALGFQVTNGAAIDFTIDIGVPQLERGSTVKPAIRTTGTAYNGIAPIFDRSALSGAYYRVGMDGNGGIAAELFDGVTTRRATSPLQYNNGSWSKVGFEYTPAGAASSLVVKVNGLQVTTTGNIAAMLAQTKADSTFTVGNDRTLLSAFPGSIALVQVGATVPTVEQSAWTYAQERQMFNDGAQVTLGDAGTLLDIDYDSVTDQVIAVSGAYESTFNGLVRTNAAAAQNGAFLKSAARSGCKMLARSTVQPGVDVTIPSQNLKEQLYKRAEDAARAARLTRRVDFDFIAGQVDAAMPPGTEIQGITSVGLEQREGSTKAWIRKFDGFKETATFNAAPGAVWVQAEVKGAAQ